METGESGGTGTEMTGETSVTCTLVDADRGKKVKVRVSFTDNGGIADERRHRRGAGFASVAPNTPHDHLRSRS